MRRALTTIRRSRDRLLTREDVDGQFVEADGERVDFVVVGDHGFGEGHVGFVKGPRGVLDGGCHERRDFDEALLHFA